MSEVSPVLGLFCELPEEAAAEEALALLEPELALELAPELELELDSGPELEGSSALTRTKLPKPEVSM
jgi:hypothetical protein